ncbi:MAG: AAA family ATPase, partial [Pseudonocardiaceae bacterium]
MLRSFRLANHRSFRDEHELLLMPSYDNDRDVVPVAAVFGANASGKSNLLNGLQLMSTLVRGWGTREPRSSIPRSPFRLAPKSLFEPSSFAVELVLDGVRYAYGFAVDDERVIREWLHAYPFNRRRVLLERDGRSITFGSTTTQRTRVEVIEELLTDDTLFLAVAARLKLDQYQPVIQWFRLSLLFVRRSQFRFHWADRDERLARFVERSDTDRAAFLTLARVADVGISDVAVEYVDDPRAAGEAEALQATMERLKSEMADADHERLALAETLGRAQSRLDIIQGQLQRPRLLLIHSGVRFELGDESEGTQLWLDLLPNVITGLNSGRTLVIDEIDSSLHPLLV